MKTSKCNDLELRLVTPSVCYHSTHENDEEKQLISTLCRGRSVADCDATELQGRAIITVARRQLHREAALAATAALSMKRSLQRFLQKRKTRAQSTSPYDHHHYTPRYQCHEQ